MRTLLMAVVAALSLTAAGCTRENEGDQPDRPRGSTVIEPETRVDVVPQEEPAVARTQWSVAMPTTSLAVAS